MAETVGLVSGIMTIVAATNSGLALLNMLNGIKNINLHTKQLKDDVKGLTDVLEPLQKLVNPNDPLLQRLEGPLSQCKVACDQYLTSFVSQSGKSGVLRMAMDWVRFKKVESETIHLSRMISSYKSTIIIALVNANLDRAGLTLQNVEEYKVLITNTTVNLEYHLQAIKFQLQSLQSQTESSTSTATASDAFEVQRMSAEQVTTEDCIAICKESTAYLEMKKQLILSTPPQNRSIEIFMTDTTLSMCCNALTLAVTELEAHGEHASEVVPAGSMEERHDSQPLIDAQTQRLEVEAKSTEVCLSYCKEASKRVESGGIHIIRDASVGNNSSQLFIGSNGDVVNAERISAGDSSVQFFGSLPGTSVNSLFEILTRRQ